MSFVFDNVVFTPDEFIADSGQRNVAIEFTINENPIVNGTIGALIFSTSSFPISGDTSPSAISGSETFYLNLDNATPVCEIFVVVTSDGNNCMATVSIVNDAPDASNRYIGVLLPSGEVAMSDAISVPGIGGGGPG